MKKYDTSLFSSNAVIRGRDFRDVTFNSERDEEDEKYYNSVSYNVNNSIQYGNVNVDYDKNVYYIPEELKEISIFEAKVRVINNEIDNYTNAANANTRRRLPLRPYNNSNSDQRVTSGMIYMDKNVGQQKRKETINNMDTKPDDYVFVGKVKNGSSVGFIGVDGNFVENWGAPVDTSKVKYYNDLEECVTDSVMFNYKNSNDLFTTSNSRNPFIAIEKKDLPKTK